MKKNNQDYQIPDFVKQSPNYERLFLREIEIVKSPHGKWGHKYNDEKRVDFEYDTFFEAYYDLGRFHKRAIWYSDEIALEVFEMPEWKGRLADKYGIGNVFFKEGSRGTSRLYSRKHGDDYVCLIEEAFMEWNKLNEGLEESSFKQENLVEIYLWLNTHPKFWLEREIGEYLTWVMDDGISLLSAELFHVSVETGEIIENYHPNKGKIAKKVQWKIEGGYHVIEDQFAGYCGIRYYDMALDSYGDTYDEALVNFAKNVWLQGQGLLKEQEEKRDAWLASLNGDFDKEDNKRLLH